MLSLEPTGKRKTKEEVSGCGGGGGWCEWGRVGWWREQKQSCGGSESWAQTTALTCRPYPGRWGARLPGLDSFDLKTGDGDFHGFTVARRHSSLFCTWFCCPHLPSWGLNSSSCASFLSFSPGLLSSLSSPSSSSSSSSPPQGLVAAIKKKSSTGCESVTFISIEQENRGSPHHFFDFLHLHRIGQNFPLLVLLTFSSEGAREKSYSEFFFFNQTLRTSCFTHRISNRGSSLILAARSRLEAGVLELKMDPGRSPVSADGPLSGSAYWSVICLSMGRPIRYSSLEICPAGPWYIQSSLSSFFLTEHQEVQTW